MLRIRRSFPRDCTFAPSRCLRLLQAAIHISHLLIISNIMVLSLTTSCPAGIIISCIIAQVIPRLISPTHRRTAPSRVLLRQHTCSQPCRLFHQKSEESPESEELKRCYWAAILPLIIRGAKPSRLQAPHSKMTKINLEKNENVHLLSLSYETSFVLHCISSPLFSMRMVGSEKINSELTLIITWWLKCEGKSQCKTKLMNCDSTFDLWGAEPSRLQAPHSKMTKINLKKRNWSLAVYKYLQVMNGLQRIDQFWIDINH